MVTGRLDSFASRRNKPIEAHPQLAEIAFDLEPPRPMHHPEATSLDMNALIDVCLVLLIFFIMTATYAAVQKVVPVEFTADTQEGAWRAVLSSCNWLKSPFHSVEISAVLRHPHIVAQVASTLQKLTGTRGLNDPLASEMALLHAIF